MKRPFALLLLCGLAVLYADDLVAGPAQSAHREASQHCALPAKPISAEDILCRALAARGGAEAAARIQSFHCQGTADFAWGGRCAYESLSVRPNQERTLFDFGGGSRYEFVCDGQTAWEIRPGRAPAALNSERLRESLDAAGFFAWYANPSRYRSITYSGETVFGGVKCYELKLTTQSGLEQTHYYNAPTVEVGLLSGDGWFQGKLNPAHTKVTGSWKQSGHSVRVSFRRLALPQTPKSEGRDPKEVRKPERETRT